MSVCASLAEPSATDDSVLNTELRVLVAWSDWHALRGKRAQAVAPKLAALAVKLGISEMRVTARFWILVGGMGRMKRIGEEPEAHADGTVRRGKFGKTWAKAQ